MIENLLVANRGEIALRVFRSCADAGIGTVAVHSDADAGAEHVRAADAAVALPGNAAAETYLRPELLIRAARRAGADAVHPGYGFLSENAEFARAVLDAGLTWVGPPPAAIETMSSKTEAKDLMSRAGVPVLRRLDAGEIGAGDLPVLVKASSGGGGRGMRVVEDLDELDTAVRGAADEAASAFGDPSVFCEPYLPRGRHIEVQVLADEYGTVLALGERECSIQRRHQKVVEEAPSPLVDETMRLRLFEAARSAAKAVGYVGAGTVEFLATTSGEFYFLEMNTRLQVEHPVTECTTGVDLVDEQLRVAEGHRLGPEPATRTGHAIEARLYAETVTVSNGVADWQPQSGTLRCLRVPAAVAEFSGPRRYGVRMDSGVGDGSVVSVHYDPMLAKLVAWGPDRTSAARMLAAALARARIHGLATNRDLLVNVLRHRAFLAGETDTSFFGEHGLDVLAEPLAGEYAVRLSALAAALGLAAANREHADVQAGLPSGWRNVAGAYQRKTFTVGEREYEVAYRLGRDGLRAPGYDDVALLGSTPRSVLLEVGGVRRSFEIGHYPGLVTVDSPFGPVSLVPRPRFTDPAAAVPAGSLVAPMPGSVVRVAVRLGETVESGQPLLWLEAMKMEHRITAPSDGVVSELPVSSGQRVELGTVLAVVGPSDEGA